MLRSLSFAKKILLAAALVVVFAFTCFILYNDYRQREAVRTDTENYLGEIGTLTASNIQSWLEGRMHLVEGLASQLALLDQPDEANIARQLEQPVFSRNFASVYLGEAASGAFTMRPYDAMPEGYDPRTRAWYKDALAARPAYRHRTLRRCRHRRADPRHVAAGAARRSTAGRRRRRHEAGDPDRDPQFPEVRWCRLRLPGQRRRQDPPPPRLRAGPEDPRRSLSQGRTEHRPRGPRGGTRRTAASSFPSPR